MDAREIRLPKPRAGATRPRRTGRGRVDANTVKPLSKNPGAVHEGFTGLRLELLPLRRESTDAASTLYVKGQLGFLTVAGQGGDVRDIHHAGLGLMLTNGPLVGSYFESGRGVNDVFLDGRKRFKLDALLLFDTRRAVTPFAQLVVDTDMGHGPDSIQSYFGLSIDVWRLFE